MFNIYRGRGDTMNNVPFIVYDVSNNIIIYIVRIEFPPVVEIGDNRGHYFPQETTNEGPTLTNAWACYNLYCLPNVP